MTAPPAPGAAAPAGLIDVAEAVRTVRELAPAGELPAPEQARALVRELRAAAGTAEGLVFEVMALPPATEAQARRAMAAGSVAVVDRLGWAEANARTFAQLAAELEPLVARPQGSGLGRLAGRLPGARRASQLLARRTASAQTGAVLAILSGRVLGQFDPFGAEGRLLLVAPNVYRIERALRAVPRDFRLWVALHEQTHRAQFAAAPWLRAHLRELLAQFAAGADPDYRRLGAVLRRLPDALRRRASLIDVTADPAQQRVLDRVTAVMSLLEGHADVVMDAVGPGVIPTVADIRRAFDTRRADAGGVRGAVADLLGLTAKLRQYERGAVFVRAVVAARGHTGLARVWEGPDLLPAPEEIADPDRWLARVPAHG